MHAVFLIDTDTASDDAVAIINGVTLAGCSCGGDYDGCRHVLAAIDTQCLYTAELCGLTFRYMGADKPLARRYENATWFHGRDGLGDHGYPAPRRAPGKFARRGRD